MMNRLLTTCLVSLVFAAPVTLIAAEPNVDEQDALYLRGADALKKFNEATETLTGGFTQVVSKQGATPETSSGSFRLKRPGRFTWTYEYPYEQQLVADGVNLWDYDVDLDQITVRDQSEALAQSPAMILSGGVDPLSEFDYQGSLESNDLLWVQLAAKEDNGDFGVLRLGFRDGQLAAMMLGDDLQQTTEIQFDDVIRNAPLDDALFEFTPPDGVDVYGTPAGQLVPNVVTPVVSGLG